MPLDSPHYHFSHPKTPYLHHLRLQRDKHARKKISLFAYLIHIPDAIGGFIKGLITTPIALIYTLDAPFEGHPIKKILQAIRASILSPFILAEDKFLVALDENDHKEVSLPLTLPDCWVTNNNGDLTDISGRPIREVNEMRLSFIGYTRVAFAFIVGLALGLVVKAPIVAAQNIFLNQSDKEAFLMSVLKIPFNILADIYTTVIYSAMDWANNEKLLILKEPNTLAKKHSKAQGHSGRTEYPFSAFMKGLLGIIFGIIFTPFYMIWKLLTEALQLDKAIEKDSRYPSESVFQWLMRIPIRVLKALDLPFILANNWLAEKPAVKGSSTAYLHQSGIAGSQPAMNYQNFSQQSNADNTSSYSEMDAFLPSHNLTNPNSETEVKSPPIAKSCFSDQPTTYFRGSIKY